jgi:DnaK suppressor protein
MERTTSELDMNYFKNLFQAMLKNHQATNTLNLFKTERGGDDIDILNQEKEEGLKLKLETRKTFYIKKVKGALDKIEDGSFGSCEDCGDDINKSRLIARPMATMCIHCKEEAEREEGHVLYSKKSHSLGKQINTSQENVIAFPTQDDVKIVKMKYQQQQ